MIPAILAIGGAGAVAFVLACLTDSRTTVRPETTAARTSPLPLMRALPFGASRVAVHHPKHTKCRKNRDG